MLYALYFYGSCHYLVATLEALALPVSNEPERWKEFFQPFKAAYQDEAPADHAQEHAVARAVKMLFADCRNVSVAKATRKDVVLYIDGNEIIELQMYPSKEDPHMMGMSISAANRFAIEYIFDGLKAQYQALGSSLESKVSFSDLSLNFWDNKGEPLKSGRFCLNEHDTFEELWRTFLEALEIDEGCKRAFT